MDKDKYDTFWRRFFAGLLDGIVLMPVALLDFLFEPTNSPSAIVMGMFLTNSIFYIYSVGLHWRTGQTLGKKWMNIRVVDTAENKLLTFRQSFMRDSIYIFLETLGLIIISFQIMEMGHYPIQKTTVGAYLNWLGTGWFLLEIITMLTNDKRRAFHDLMAGSVVIKEEYWSDSQKMNES